MVDVAIAEDYLLFRHGIVSFLKEEQKINMLFEADNGKELIEKLQSSRPHIVIMDIRMPVMDGRQALEIIRYRFPEIRVIILSMHYSDPYISEFINAGAAGFLPKNCAPEMLIDAIYTVYDQGYYYDNYVSKVVSDLVKTKKSELLPGHLRLTPREIDILRLLCAEKTTAEIGDELNISARTVEWHRKNILEKTNTKGVAGLVMYAIRMGIIPNPEDLFN
jgi:two-component system response regulator DegU